MGYSHYWYRRRTIASSRYQAIVEDLSRLLPELKRQDVPLAGAFGTGRPRIDRQEIVIARRHLGDDIRIASDGGQAQWFDARLLCQSVLGYGLTLPLGLHDE